MAIQLSKSCFYWSKGGLLFTINCICDALCGLEIRSNDFLIRIGVFGSLQIVVGKRKERIAHQNLLSSSRTGSSFSIRWKGSKNLVKTNPQPGVLTALALARIKVCCKFEECQFYNYCSEFFAVQIGVQPSMGEILVARGPSGTKEWRPGYERTKENRPWYSVL